MFSCSKCLEVANWPVIFFWPAWFSLLCLIQPALGPLHCCQESEAWQYDPHMVYLRFSLNTKVSRAFATRALKLWNNSSNQISLAKSVTSFCVPAEKFPFQNKFLWFCDFILLSKASMVFYSFILYCLFSFSLFAFYFILCSCLLVCCLVFAFLCVFYAVRFQSCKAPCKVTLREVLYL